MAPQGHGDLIGNYSWQGSKFIMKNFQNRTMELL